MKLIRMYLAAAMLTACLGLVAPARAGLTTDEVAVETVETPSTESKVGALAALACGLGIRYFVPIAELGGVGGIAGIVAVCLFATFDAFAEYR